MPILPHQCSFIRFELLIDSKAAETLSITIPPSLRISANKVIE